MSNNHVHFTDPTGDYDHEDFNLEDALRALIRKSTQTIHLISFSLPAFNRNWFLHDILSTAISNTGVKLIVYGNNHTEVQRLVAEYRSKGAKGYAWQSRGERDIFHIKAIMVDRELIYLGSANLSENAITESSEWGIISSSSQLCSKLENYLQSLFESGRFLEV